MKRSKEAIRTARQFLQRTLVDGKLDESRARLIVKRIKEGKPRGYAGILDAYVNLVRLEMEKRHAVIESATELDGALKDRIRQDLTARYGDDLSYDFRVVPELLGGTRIRVGSDVWDGSVKARLARLSDAIG